MTPAQENDLDRHLAMRDLRIAVRSLAELERAVAAGVRVVAQFDDDDGFVGDVSLYDELGKPLGGYGQ